MPKTIIFTDIDGTLIDFETFSWAEVEPAVSRLITRQIPIVLCSSKTIAEQENLREVLGIPDPYIVENGSAIIIPAGYFGPGVPAVIELGVAAATIRKALNDIRQQTELEFQGYSDLTVTEVCEVTGLDIASATMAKLRDYSETIVTPLTPATYQQLHKSLMAYDLTLVSGGKFYTVMSSASDKGTAVTVVSNLYQEKWGDIVTIALGDSTNDVSMLAVVEQSFVVQKPDGRWQDMGDLAVTKVPAVGPSGWRLVAESFLE